MNDQVKLNVEDMVGYGGEDSPRRFVAQFLKNGYVIATGEGATRQEAIAEAQANLQANF